MVHLLTKIKKNTIRHQMYRYLFTVIGAAVLMNVFFTVFHNLNILQYEKVMTQVLNLNQFYVRLDESNSNFRYYVQNGDETFFKNFSSYLEEAENYLDQIGEERVSQSFVRDIQDIRGMLNSYTEIALSVRNQYIQNRKNEFTSDMLNEMLQLYDTSQEVFERIDNEFKNVHLRLLNFTNERMKLLKWKNRIYQIEFLFIMLFWLGRIIVKGRKLADKIVVPIQKLTEAAKQIQNGDMLNFPKVEFPIADNQELNVLISVFHMMIDKIREQFQSVEEAAQAKEKLQVKELENLRMKHMLQSSELKVLQMQMNPHFLFNTLNMITKTAYLNESDETVFLLQKTAQLLRYSLDYMGKSVTLARELEILDCYICLQEKRFGDRMEFDFDLDERFHNIQIPCLILQPLVENAVTHGVGMYQKGGKILIRTRWLEQEKTGIISVIDNGIGMDEEKLEYVRRKLNADWDAEEGIGLGNVSMRLRHFFHNEGKLEIYSNQRKETEVRIEVPVKERGVDEDVSVNYC